MNKKQFGIITLGLGVSLSTLAGCNTQGTTTTNKEIDQIPTNSEQSLDIQNNQEPNTGKGFMGNSQGGGHRNGRFGSEQTIPPSSNQTTSTSQSSSSEKVSQTSNTIKTVAISNACIGCGKCARIASTTFAMSNHKATVISQNYASSDAVQHAASNCPVGAISVS